jgi:thioredoxin-like negative regulator of GroEL
MIHLTLNILLQAAAVTAGGQDYATAYQTTITTGQPLVVLVGADWCPGCQQMKHSAIPQVEKLGGLSRFQFAIVNTDQQSELAGRLMQGGTIPQLILFHKTDTGWKRQQLTGTQDVSAIQAFLSQAEDASAVKLSRRD